MKTVLVVEDVPAVRTYIVRLLADYPKPLRLLEAGNGVEAYRLLKDETVDILITDIFLPFMDGLHLLQKLREEGSTVKTIIVSAYDDFEFARRALTLSVDAYLLKPVKKTELYSSMDRLLEVHAEKPARTGPFEGLWCVLLERGPRALLEKAVPSRYVREMGSFQTEQERERAVVWQGGSTKSLWDEAEHVGQMFCAWGAEAGEPAFAAYALRTGSESACREAYRAAQLLLHRRFLTAEKQALFSVPAPQPKISGQQRYKLDDLEQLRLLSRFSETGSIRGVLHEAFQRLWRMEDLTYAEVMDFFLRLQDLYRFLFVPASRTESEYSEMLSRFSLRRYVDREDAENSICAVFGQFEESGDRRELQNHALMISYLQQYLQRNYAEPIRLYELSDQLGFNEDYLGRLFREQTGKSFSAYLTELRMRYAREMLEHSGKTVTQVAFDCGYNSTSNFISIFRRTFGETPMALRKRLNAKEPGAEEQESRDP